MESGLEPVQTGDESKPRQKKRKIVDPQKRADTRSADGANLLQHKRRDSRRERVDASQFVFLLMKSTNKFEIEILVKRQSAGYECHFVMSSKFRIVREM